MARAEHPDIDTYDPSAREAEIIEKYGHMFVTVEQGEDGRMTEPQDWMDEGALIESAERWVAEVNAAYADGGYASGDGPVAPLDEMEWLLSERKKALRIIEAWHQFANHLDRIVEASPNMGLAEAVRVLDTDRQRIDEARRG